MKMNNVQNSNLTTEPTEFLCSKHCLNLYYKNSKKPQAALNYLMTDKKHPHKQCTEDFRQLGKCSHDFVMDWLTMESNYSKYVGGFGQEGRTKKVFCTRVAKEISSSNINQTRSLKDIYK